MSRFKIESNSDLFAKRGDPWEVTIKKLPNLSPDGSLRLTPKAHTIFLREEASNLSPDSPQTEGTFSEDGVFLDHCFADHCLPISIRLAKERNRLVPSMTAKEGQSLFDPVLAKRISARNKITKLQKRLIKV